MFRLAHISDLHLTPMPAIKWHQLLNKRITGYLNWKLNRKHNLHENTLKPLMEHMHEANPDHIVVSGDLVNLSLNEEFKHARRFLDGLGNSKDVSTICGNHDAYVAGANEEATACWRPFLVGDGVSETQTPSFPYLRKRGDVALIGCNSAEPTPPFFATGYFRKQQADRLRNILEQTKDLCRVVMIHHPPIHLSLIHI